jgi:hypothetical protein
MLLTSVNPLPKVWVTVPYEDNARFIEVADRLGLSTENWQKYLVTQAPRVPVFPSRIEVQYTIFQYTDEDLVVIKLALPSVKIK